MPCYAMACHQVRPCASQQLCELVWHACTPPEATTVWHFTCGDCVATWTYHVSDHLWHRDPLEGAAHA